MKIMPKDVTTYTTHSYILKENKTEKKNQELKTRKYKKKKHLDDGLKFCFNLITPGSDFSFFYIFFLHKLTYYIHMQLQG